MDTTLYRINRMMLGVSEQFRAVFQTMAVHLIDVDRADDIPLGATVIIGRQHIHERRFVFAHELLPGVIDRRPKLIFCSLAERYIAHRYAADHQQWQAATNAGIKVVVLELPLIQQLGAAAVVGAIRTMATQPGTIGFLAPPS